MWQRLTSDVEAMTSALEACDRTQGGSKSSSYQSGNPKRDVTFGSPEGIYMLKQWEIGHFRRRFSSTFKYNTT